MSLKSFASNIYALPPGKSRSNKEISSAQCHNKPRTDFWHSSSLLRILPVSITLYPNNESHYASKGETSLQCTRTQLSWSTIHLRANLHGIQQKARAQNIVARLDSEHSCFMKEINQDYSQGLPLRPDLTLNILASPSKWRHQFQAMYM